MATIYCTMKHTITHQSKRGQTGLVTSKENGYYNVFNKLFFLDITNPVHRKDLISRLKQYMCRCMSVYLKSHLDTPISGHGQHFAPVITRYPLMLQLGELLPPGGTRPPGPHLTAGYTGAMFLAQGNEST